MMAARIVPQVDAAGGSGFDATDRGSAARSRVCDRRRCRRAAGRRRGEHQFVVVAAGQQASRAKVGCRQVRRFSAGGNSGLFEDVAEVGEQAVGHVDRRSGHALQPRPSSTRGCGRCRAARQSPRSWVRSAPCGPAGGRGPARRGRAGRKPRSRRRLWRRSRRRAATDSGTSPKIVTQKLRGPRVVSPPIRSMPNSVGAGEEAAGEGGDPRFIGVRQGGGQRRPARPRAHRRHVGDIHREGLPAEVRGVGVGQEMRALHQHVGGDHQFLTGRGAISAPSSPTPSSVWESAAREMARDEFEFRGHGIRAFGSPPPAARRPACPARR
jgi:hypothetical protein